MHHLVNYSQIMPPVPLCLEKWGGGHDPQLPWERRPCVSLLSVHNQRVFTAQSYCKARIYACVAVLSACSSVALVLYFIFMQPNSGQIKMLACCCVETARRFVTHFDHLFCFRTFSQQQIGKCHREF